MSFWLPTIDSAVFFDGLKSFFLVLTLLIVRTLIVQTVTKNLNFSMDVKRRWVVSTRNATVFLALLGLIVIWAHELQAFAVSLVALAAALVLAAKELILCWSGAALRMGGAVYVVGDCIQIGTHRGVVLGHDIFATKLLEIGPGPASHLYTGRVIVFPNSLLFASVLIKENFGQAYALHILIVPLKESENWQIAERHLLEAATAECSLFMGDASRHMKLLEQATFLEAPSAAPRVTLQLSETGRIQLVLRFPAPDRARTRIEQSIMRRYLTQMTPIT